MTFANYIKTRAKLEIIKKGELFVTEIKAQYNPDRFKFWQNLYNGPAEDVLDIKYSPHVDLLKLIAKNTIKKKLLRTTKYYQMQKLYGRNDEWILNKINNFINLFEYCRDSGQIKIEVVEKPLVRNIYNSGYEVYEGTHRLACAVYLGKHKINSVIYTNKGLPFNG